jgi:hypothetical protein
MGIGVGVGVSAQRGQRDLGVSYSSDIVAAAGIQGSISAPKSSMFALPRLKDFGAGGLGGGGGAKFGLWGINTVTYTSNPTPEVYNAFK